VSGIAFVVLFAAGNSLWAFDAPETGSPAGEILQFYGDASTGIIAGAALSLLSLASFAVFAAAVRSLLVDAEGEDLLATTAFGGAGLALASGLGAESINMVGGLRAVDGELTEALAQSVFEISQVLGTVAAAVGVAVFAVSTAVVALRTRQLLPRPLALLVLAVGVSLLTPAATFLVWPGMAMVLTTLVLAVALLRPPREAFLARSASAGQDEAPPPE
jgi:hypothetical protein